MAESSSSGSDGDRIAGASATGPAAFPLRGWVQIARRVWRGVGRNHMTQFSAALAFFALMAIVPALTLTVAIYGLWADPASMQRLVGVIRGLVPREGMSIISEQLERLITAPSGGLGLGALVSIVVLAWSLSTGTTQLINAINTVYEEEEKRSFLHVRGLALLLSLAGLLVFLVSASSIALLPAASALFGVSERLEGWLEILRWPALGFVFMAALAVIYRVSPHRRAADWRWVTPGSMIACILWLAGSGIFSLYVESFGRYGETYGSLGGVVVLLLWLYMSAFVVLLGAEINAEAEHQTAIDSTVGPDRPLGERGAWAADYRPQIEEDGSGDAEDRA